MSFIKITNYLKSANKTDQAIIRLIIANSKKIENLTLNQIAEMSHVSHSSVSRVIKKTGFSNWKEFIFSCKLEQLFSEAYIIQQQNQSLLDKISIQSLHSHGKIGIFSKEISKAANIILKAKTTILYGYRLAGNIAQYLSFNFADRGLMCTHAYFENDLWPLFQRGNVLILLVCEEFSDYLNTIQKACDNYTKIIIIDALGNPKLAEISKQNDLLYLPAFMIPYFENDEEKGMIKAEILRTFGIQIFEEWWKKYKA